MGEKNINCTSTSHFWKNHQQVSACYLNWTCNIVPQGKDWEELLRVTVIIIWTLDNPHLFSIAQFTDRLSREATDVAYLSAHLPRTFSPTQGFTFERNRETGTLTDFSMKQPCIWDKLLLCFLNDLALCSTLWNMYLQATLKCSLLYISIRLSAVISILEHSCSVQRAVMLVEMASVNWDSYMKISIASIVFLVGEKNRFE